MKRRREPNPNPSDFARLVNLAGKEKRLAVVGCKIEPSVKRAITLVLKPGQTPSEWIREAIIRRLREEAS